MLIMRYLSIKVTELNAACSQTRKGNIYSLTYNLCLFQRVKRQLLMQQAINFSYSLISLICETTLVLCTQWWGVDMQRSLWGSCFFPHTSAETNTYRKKGMIVITWLTNMKNMQKYENYISS